MNWQAFWIAFMVLETFLTLKVWRSWSTQLDGDKYSLTTFITAIVLTLACMFGWGLVI